MSTNNNNNNNTNSQNQSNLNPSALPLPPPSTTNNVTIREPLPSLNNPRILSNMDGIAPIRLPQFPPAN